MTSLAPSDWTARKRRRAAIIPSLSRKTVAGARRTNIVGTVANDIRPQGDLHIIIWGEVGGHVKGLLKG